MALVNAYCTLAEVRDQLSDKDGLVADAILERAITATSRAVDDWCGRRFWADPTPVARKYRPSDCTEIEVDDISTLTGLVVETDPSLDGSWSASWVLDTDFELGPDNADADGGAYSWCELRAIAGKRFTIAARRSLRVTARFGWSAIPDQVNQATILRAVAIFKRKDSPHGVAGFGDFGAIRITRKDPDVIDLLTPFQKPMV